MKKILVFIFILLQYPLIAQKSSDLIEVADEIYKFGDYKDALDIYKQILKTDSSNVYANLMAGKCSLELTEKEKSLPYLLKAYTLDDHATFNIHFLVASSFQLNYEFDKAIEYYNLYNERLKYERAGEGLDDKEEFKKVERRILECNYGKQMVAHPNHVVIENIGDSLNSEFSDYAPVISSDESAIYFTSRRRGSTGNFKDNDNEFFEDIYYSHKENGRWKQAANIGSHINTNLHEACIGLSPDGRELFIYKDDDKYKGDIFFCTLDKENKWSKPKPLNKNINTKYIENSVSISSDGKLLFFSSDRPGGYGGMDIYVSHLSPEGDWNEPTNLGSTVNTEYDDESPFYYTKDQVLFFSSKGHDGMGSFDLFKSSFISTSNKWSKPVNLGFPMNSPDADIYYVLSGDGKYAYYSSVKGDCFGGIDLYKIQVEFNDSLPIAENKVVEKSIVKNSVTYSIQIKVIDQDGKKPLNAKVRVLDVKTNRLLMEKFTEGSLANLALNLDSSMELLISAESDGYVFKSDKILINPDIQNGKTIKKELVLSKIAVGYRYVLRNIYFDNDKATLKPESKEELERLFQFLKSNPKVVAVLEGHTDNNGSQNYNASLSLKRSGAVRKYLIDKGISPSRLVARGYGESRPLASNDDEEEGRSLNRRTEFLITKK